MTKSNIKVLLLSKYGNLGASSRVRSYQYLEYLENNNINVTISELLSDEYLEILYRTGNNSKKIIFVSYIKRFYTLLKAIIFRQYDVLWIEKELFPWIPFLFEAFFYKTNIPVLVDYDDPIFHFYDSHKSTLVRSLLGKKISKIMRCSSHVSVSSHYMFDYAEEKGSKKVSIIPPAVDFRRYKKVNRDKTKICTIGWIGSPSATKYLNTIEKALIEINLHNKVEFILIGAGVEVPKFIPFTNLIWSEDTEEEDMSRFDIGIMPLSNDFSSIARDHYKLVKYMASSIPYVTSPVRETILVTENGINGFVANNIEDWVRTLSFLIKNSKERELMGEKGFLIAKDRFSIEEVHKEIIKIIKNISVKN